MRAMRYLILMAVMVGCAHLPAKPHDGYDDGSWRAPVVLDVERLPETEWAYVPAWTDAAPGSGGAIKTWGSGDTLTSADLNANFQHIHNNMVGGHGGRLTDADVSASANIASSKLAAYHLIPVAWGSVAECTGSPCTIISSSGISSVTRTSAGVYTVNLTTSRPNTSYMAMTWNYKSYAGAGEICWTTAITVVGSFPVLCASDLVPTSADSSFTFVVYDND